MGSKHLRVAAEIKASAEGVIEGYGSVFGNVDSYGDIVMPGAFEVTLRSAPRLPAMLWQHDAAEPIGVWSEMREDKRGLWVKGQLALGTQRGREALELIQLGALTGLSIGYRTVKSTYDEQTGVRSLSELELWEVSPVTFPANEAARITGAKASEIASIKDFERFLRDAGFSRKEAKRIAAQGFGEPGLCDADTEDADETDDLGASIRQALGALRRD